MLRYRVTDQKVHESQVQPLDRVGLESKIVETYPIAALRLWGITFVCALVARLVSLAGRATGPKSANLDKVEEEGWIHLPHTDHPLDSLSA